MNQLAVAIRNFSDDRKDSERFSLTPLELIALRSIGSIVKMPPDALATYLEQEGEPTEWLIVPYVVYYPLHDYFYTLMEG